MRRDGMRADFSSLFTPTTSEGTLLTTGYNGFGSDFSAISRAANEAKKQRGYEINQRNISGNVDLTLSNSSFASFKVGHFYDNYKDTGIPNTTSYTYQTSSIGAARPCRRRSRVASTFNNTPQAQITELRHGPSGRSSTPTTTRRSRAGGLHTLKGGFGIQRTVNEVDNSLSRRIRGHLLGPHVHQLGARASAPTAAPMATTR